MKRLVNWKIFIVSWGFVALIAFGISAWSGFSFWWASVLVAIAMVINGVIAEVEDRSRGGFLKPEKEEFRK